MVDPILSLLRENQRFVVTTHMRPDGDALGSQLALGRFLQRLGKDVLLLNSDPCPDNLGWMPGVDDIALFDRSIAQRERVDAADVVLVLDTNSHDRLGYVAPVIRHSGGVKALIDHHTNPEDWFDVTYVRDTASSTGELVYEIIVAHDASMIDTEIAQVLYTAIMTDTGSFRYSNVTPGLHRIVADLLERGAFSPVPIHTAVYDTRSVESLRLLAMVLSTLTLRDNGKVAYIVVSQRMLHEAKATSEDTEGFVNYALSLDGVQVALMFSETPGGTKVSFRSKADAHVNEWARAFGGGGHRNASGAFIERPLQDVIDKVVAAAPRFLDLAAPDDDGELTPEDASYLSSLLDLKSQNSKS